MKDHQQRCRESRVTRRTAAAAMGWLVASLAIGSWPALAQDVAPTASPSPPPNPLVAILEGPYGVQFKHPKLAAYALATFEKLDYWLDRSFTADTPEEKEKARKEHDTLIRHMDELHDRWTDEGVQPADLAALAVLVGAARTRSGLVIEGKYFRLEYGDLSASQKLIDEASQLPRRDRRRRLFTFIKECRDRRLEFRRDLEASPQARDEQDLQSEIVHRSKRTKDVEALRKILNALDRMTAFLIDRED